MKTRTLIYALSLFLIIACKKNTTNKTATPVKSNPTIPNKYIKGKFTGYYINIADTTDTLFVYTPFAVDLHGDTGSSAGDPNGDIYSIYCNQLLNHIVVNTILKRPIKNGLSVYKLVYKIIKTLMIVSLVRKVNTAIF